MCIKSQILKEILKFVVPVMHAFPFFQKSPVRSGYILDVGVVAIVYRTAIPRHGHQVRPPLFRRQH